MGWFQNFVNNSPHLFGEDSDFSETSVIVAVNLSVNRILKHCIYVLIVRLENKIYKKFREKFFQKKFFKIYFKKNFSKIFFSL